MSFPSKEKDGKDVKESADDERPERFEDILRLCCGTGRWQTALVAYMSLMWLVLPFFSMSMMFVGATPKFKCADGFDTNATFASLPPDAPQCRRLGSNASCTRWVFDQSLYQSTVVTEWDLVCARRPLLSLLQALLMLGGLTGAVAAGQLADRLGRRPVFLPAMLLLVAMAFATALITDYRAFAACRFFSGLAMALMIGSQYVLVTELGGAEQRARHTALTLMPFSLGIVLVAALSYAVRGRRLLQLAYAVPCLALVPNVALMPESPRWLALRGRLEEAYTVLARGARWNGTAIPSKDVVLALLERMQAGEAARPAAGSVGHASRRLRDQLLQLLRTPRMRRYTLATGFVWFVVSGAYFGIAFDTTQLSRQPHLAGLLLGLSELPTVLYFPIIDRLGRRPPTAVCFLLAAAAMFASLALRAPPLRLAVGLLGKLSVGLAFCMLYTFSPEYIPTSARAAGFGVCQLALRLGATAAPFVVDVAGQAAAGAPAAVFGAASLLAALVTLLLPETRLAGLPDTVADVERGVGPEAAARGAQPEGRPAGASLSSLSSCGGSEAFPDTGL